MMRFWLHAPILAAVAALLAVPAAGAAGGGEYRFAPGDVIEISVFPQHSFDRTLTVQPDGKISYPIVGQVQAAGLSASELAGKLRAGLSGELADPQFTVSLKELNKSAAPRVSVLGAVKSPGVVEIRDGTAVAEALAAVGGPTPQADLRHLAITRSDGSTLTVDLSSPNATGSAMRGVVLQPGDILFVASGPAPTALLLGEVAKPGPIDLQGETRLLNAISAAGGPTAKADLRHVKLARSSVSGTQTLDLEPLFAGRDLNDPRINVTLQPGDTIVIPDTDQRIYVLGRVARPDIYPIKPEDRVLDALARAGGAGADADLSKAALVRRNEKGQPVPRTLDLKKIMSTGDPAENALLRPGDILFIPDLKTRRSGTELVNLLWPLTSLVTLFHR